MSLRCPVGRPLCPVAIRDDGIGIETGAAEVRRKEVRTRTQASAGTRTPTRIGCSSNQRRASMLLIRAFASRPVEFTRPLLPLIRTCCHGLIDVRSTRPEVQRLSSTSTALLSTSTSTMQDNQRLSMPMPAYRPLTPTPMTDTCRLTPGMPPTLESLGGFNRVHLEASEQRLNVADRKAMNNTLHRSRGVAAVYN